MKIKWVLNEFYGDEVSIVVSKILKKTKKTTVLSYGNLLCKSKCDLNMIYKILIDEHAEIQKRKAIEFDCLPNLLLESIKQFKYF